jgi:hypothetical protein
MTSPATTPGDQELKVAERAMWALGDYHRFAKQTVGDGDPSSWRHARSPPDSACWTSLRELETWPSAPQKPGRASSRQT